MRTPDEILDHNELTGSLFCHDVELNQRDRDDFIYAIKQAQIEAYNQAIEDAAENAVVKMIVVGRSTSIDETQQWNEFGYVVDEQSILKLKK